MSTRQRGRPLLVLGAAALLLAACGQKPEGQESTPDANPAATIPTAADEAAPADFVQKAALGDLFELAAAKIAAQRSTNAEVKAFAAKMTAAHTQTAEALKAAVAGSGQDLKIPTALTPDQQDKLKVLETASAEDFDEAYLDGQISAHQEMLDLMTRFANDGPTGPLKTFAIETKGGVQAHLDSARSAENGLKR